MIVVESHRVCAGEVWVIGKKVAVPCLDSYTRETSVIVATGGYIYCRTQVDIKSICCDTVISELLYKMSLRLSLHNTQVI